MDGSFNSEGLGLPLGIKAYNSNRNVGISYEPVIRYDVIDTEAFLAHKAGRVSTKVERKLFADHHFSIYRKFRFSRKAKEKTNYMGVGYSFISPGMSYDHDWIIINYTTGRVTTGSKVNWSFDGFHILYGMKLYKRFHAEGKLMYISPYRLVYNHNLSAMMFFLKATYQFSLEKNAKLKQSE